MRFSLITILLLILCSSLTAYDLYVHPEADSSSATGHEDHPFNTIQRAIDHIFDDSHPDNLESTSARIILLGNLVFNENIELNFNRDEGDEVDEGPHLITDVAIIGNMDGQERCIISAPTMDAPVITMIVAGESSLHLEGLNIRHELEPATTTIAPGLRIEAPSVQNSAMDSFVIEDCHFDFSNVAVLTDYWVRCSNQVRIVDSEFVLRYYGVSCISGLDLNFHQPDYPPEVTPSLQITGNSFVYLPKPSDPATIDGIRLYKLCGNISLEGNLLERVPVSISSPGGFHDTSIVGNMFMDSRLCLENAGTWLIDSNQFISTNNLNDLSSLYCSTSSTTHLLEQTMIQNNIFTNCSLPIEMFNTADNTRSRDYNITDNSFIDCDKVLKLWNKMIYENVIAVYNRIVNYSNNLYRGLSDSPFQIVKQDGSPLVLPEEYRIPISHSHFPTQLAQNPSLILDDTVSYGDPLIDYSEFTHTYSLLWDENQKSPLINTGYPGENGELTDPDGTPPDIGSVYYPHVNRKYFERVAPIMWLSFPVLDDRTNSDGAYWNELGYMFEEHMQSAPDSQLDQIQWSYDGDEASMKYHIDSWLNSDSPAIQQKGYKVQFNTSGAISDVVVNGFRVDAATTPVAWLAEIEENGQSHPFENWIGYFAPFREKAGNAFSHLVPGSNSRRYLDYIYSMKTQYWSTSRQTATHGSPWIIDPNKYTLSEGDMVSLILLPDAPQEMYWDNPSINVDPREIAKPTAFSYDEKLDYQPVYIEFDPEATPQEIGLFVGGECKGAAVVDSSKISVCFYNDASKADGELELVFYYEGKGKSVSEGWTVYNPQSMVFEDSGLRADEIGDYAFISFCREEGESPAPLVTSLRQNYPNPFNPSTTLSFVLGTESEANLDIFNARGQLVRSYRYDHLTKGLHSEEWDGRDSTGRAVSSGLYFYRLRTPEASFVNKMLLLK